MRLLIIICLSFYIKGAIAQEQKQYISSSKELVGTWQYNTPQLGDAYGKNFQFYKNGTFVLNYSQYNDIGRIAKITGKYEAKDSSIYLTLVSRTEVEGGKLVAGSYGFQKEEFVLNGGKPVTIKQTGEKPEPFVLTKCKSKNGAKCIQINNNKYYQISVDPNKDPQ